MSHHPGRKLGTPARRNPITGLTSETTAQMLRRCGIEEGWDFQYDGGDYVFQKDNARLRVYFWEGLITSGTLHKNVSNGRGRSVRRERVWDVLLGEKCICPTLTDDEWAKGKDAEELDECPICGTGEAA